MIQKDCSIPNIEAIDKMTILSHDICQKVSLARNIFSRNKNKMLRRKSNVFNSMVVFNLQVMEHVPDMTQSQI